MSLSSIKLSIFPLIGLGVISLAVNLLHVSNMHYTAIPVDFTSVTDPCLLFKLQTLQTMLNLTDVNELILAVFYVLGHFIYIFVLNYGCQLVTDHNADIFRVL